MEPFSGCSMGGDSAHVRIGDTGIGMFLMVPQARLFSC